MVPKGIHDPGLTAQESAAKEALEEAGARGTVDAHSLGSYSQEKWGATTQVEVYPMQVDGRKNLNPDLTDDRVLLNGSAWPPTDPVCGASMG